MTTIVAAPESAWGGGGSDHTRNRRNGKHIGPLDALFLAPRWPTGRHHVATFLVGLANQHPLGVGDQWLDALEASGRVRASSSDDGLLETMSALDGPDFTAADVDPAVRDFYEHTASWRMEVWSQWNGFFAPGGEVIARLWGRRVEQLALPVQPLAVSRGMSSVVRVVEDASGGRLGAAWLRTLRSDGSRVYSGFYRVGRLPGVAQPHVKVAFPLESGSVQVWLTPANDADGSFWLQSRSKRFGADGAYVAAQVGGRWHAAQVPLRETFHVYTDADGVLRTDHWLNIGRWQALRLHYRLDRV